MMTRSRYTLLAAGCLIGLAACDQPEPPPAAPTTPPPAAKTPPPAPDNTANNAKDADGTTKTPMDQSNAPADIEISATIRRAIMDQKGMSTNAQNCKIITENGVVTLRGTVDSQGEKDSIASIANTTPGVLRVVNELEVRTPRV